MIPLPLQKPMYAIYDTATGEWANPNGSRPNRWSPDTPRIWKQAGHLKLHLQHAAWYRDHCGTGYYPPTAVVVRLNTYIDHTQSQSIQEFLQ